MLRLRFGNITYGFNVSGHGRPSANLTCLDCHDLARSHIDGEPRTYVAAPLTYNYRDGYRLVENMTIPRTSGQVGEVAVGRREVPARSRDRT